MNQKNTAALILPVLLAMLLGCDAPNPPASNASINATAPSADSVVGQVAEITAKLMKIDRAKIQPNTSLRELGADDLDLVELTMELEEHFDITISDDAIAKNITVQKLADLVEAQKKASK